MIQSLAAALAQSSPHINRQFDTHAARDAGEVRPAKCRSGVCADNVAMLGLHRVAQRLPKLVKVASVGVCDRIQIRERQSDGEAWIDRLGTSVVGCLGKYRERKECEAGPGQAHGSL